MPFPMIPAALGVCFLLVWAFIGGMIFRDSQSAVENEREAGANLVPLMHHRLARHRRNKTRHLGGQRQSAIRAAS
jgi:hypothetical protein